MNRVIKFRAWDKKNKYMLHNVGFQYTDCGLIIKPEVGMMFAGTEEEALSHYEGRHGEDHVLMQFTGLLDRHGKETYEGDVLAREGHHRREVVWFKDAFVCKYLPYRDDEHYYRLHGYIRDGRAEVIGNRWENPDLLEKGTHDQS